MRNNDMKKLKPKWQTKERPPALARAILLCGPVKLPRFIVRLVVIVPPPPHLDYGLNKAASASPLNVTVAKDHVQPLSMRILGGVVAAFSHSRRETGPD
jgi:hypothetical protein